MEESKTWLLVWNKNTGQFRTKIETNTSMDSKESIANDFEKRHEMYTVIHIGDGAVLPKAYRSLPEVE